jgi:hypothetical protein
MKCNLFGYISRKKSMRKAVIWQTKDNGYEKESVHTFIIICVLYSQRHKLECQRNQLFPLVFQQTALLDPNVSENTKFQITIALPSTQPLPNDAIA